MMMKTLLTAAAATALLAGAAHAGDGAKKTKPADAAATQMKDESGKAMTTPGADASTMAPDTSVNPPSDAAAMPPPSSDTTAMPAASPDASAEGVPASATVASNARTNGPVADTPENRAKFKPLSRAGRATTPRGN
ncbi:hypothetical protein [Phenylobacterium sp.]|uniref:hypothetical protein n=1 Tax=Phenylobacterium sp. TaxID=1871053 RepID=UPI0025DA340A|nr:hypothetical protein [Phenylobacterium sp.]